MPLIKTSPLANLFSTLSIPAKRICSSTGLLILSTANSFMPDYNPATFAPRGTLFEPTGANNWLNSQDASLQTLNAVTTTLNAVTAPDGTLTGDAIMETAVVSGHAMYMSNAVVAGQTETMSLWVKPTLGRSFVRLFFTNGAASAVANFDFTNDTFAVTGLVGATNVSATLEKWNLYGWYRISLTATLPNAAVTLRTVSICDTIGNTVYLGDIAKGMYVWGFQTETRPFVSSYMPSTGAAGTRTFSDCRISLPSLNYNPVEGSLIWSQMVRKSAYALDFSYAGAWVMGNAGFTSSDFIDNWVNQANDRVYLRSAAAGGAQDIGASVNPAIVDMTAARFGVRLKGDNFAICKSGGAVAVDSVRQMPVDLATLRIGQTRDQVGQIWLRDLTYYSRGLSDSELQAETALAA